LVLEGEEAIKVLNEIINELMAGQAEELTKKQAKAMIKLVKGLISTIEREAQNKTSLKKRCFLPGLKNMIKGHVRVQ